MFSPTSNAVGQLIASEIAARGGFKIRDDAWIAFAAQAQRETGGVVTANNPLNLTDPGQRSLWAPFGQTGWRSGGSSAEWHTNFAAFDSLEGGARAAAANYLGDYYPNVIAALRAGADPVTLAQEIERSPWDSGHYGGTLHEAVAAAVAQGGAAAPATPMPGSAPAPAPSTIARAVLDPAITIVQGGIDLATAPIRAGISHVQTNIATQLVIGLLIVLAVVLVASAIA